MTIRLRILLFVLLAEIAGYGLVVYWSHQHATKTLSDAREQQIKATLMDYLHRIEGLTDVIARGALDLAVAGEHFYEQRAQLTPSQVSVQLQTHLQNQIQHMPQALGGGLWFEPYQFFAQRELFGPYAFWQQQKVVFTWDLSSAAYNYPQQSWYQRGLSLRSLSPPTTAVRWTAPYRDEAGSEALMMTADAAMFDRQHRFIGLATVDWSLQAVREFVADIRITPHSFGLLLDKESLLYVSFVRDDTRIMQRADRESWESAFTQVKQSGKIYRYQQAMINDQAHRLYYIETNNGLILGVLIPEQDLSDELHTILQKNMVSSALLSLIMIMIGLAILTILFRPFNRVLLQIQQSIVSDEGDNLQLTPLLYRGHNEFTPIIKALNRVYSEVMAYTQRLSQANATLAQQQSQLNELNINLEQKVLRRTSELEHKNTALAQSLIDLRAAQAQLVDAEKHVALNQLIAGVAHEINTPLGVAITATTHLQETQTQLARDYHDGQLRREQMDQFIQNADESLRILLSNLQRATELMRSFKQISVDQSSESRRQFQLKGYIDDVLLSLRPRLKKTSHQIGVDCPLELVIDSYPGAWSQILTNLIMNSLLHAFREEQVGHLQIEVNYDAQYLFFHYRDDGVGIAAEHLPHIFEPFFTTRRGQGGSGLGLHVVYNIVKQTLGGQISCRSSAGAGVEFIVQVPLQAPKPSNNTTPVI